MARIEAIRVAQDPAYARSLTNADWLALSQDPAWQELVAEQVETIAGVLAEHGHKLPGGVASSGPATQVPAGPFKVIGQSYARMQGLGIVTDKGLYTENMRMPGMLYMRTLRSKFPHARILSIDTSKAEAFPGVRMILHRGNLPAEYKDVFLGAQNPTRFLFSEEVFEVGAPIAAIAAESEHIAEEAARLITVEYEVLPAALDMMEAIKPSAAKQWDNQLDGTTINITTPLVRGQGADAPADVVVEVLAKKSFEQHLALELTNSLSYWDADKLNMTYTSQWAHGVRSGLSNALRIPQNKVRVVQSGYVGSGYGYRSGIDLSEAHAAILSKLTGRPIKNHYTRYEDFVTRTHRPEFRNEMRLGVNRDGTLQFGHFKVWANVGAQRAGAANGAWFNMQLLYTIPNLRLEATDVMTNTFKSGPYRCVSHPNGTFALEVTMEKAAYAIGKDPVEFRLQNLNEVGNPENRNPFNNPGIRDCIVAARDRIDWGSKWHAPRANEVRPGIFHGIGLAAHACSHGAGGNPSSGQVIVNSDGTAQVISALNDIGDGQRTLLMMVAAEALGVPITSVTTTPYVDTDLTTNTSGTFGSQQTNNGGRGAYEAALAARRSILALAAAEFVSEAADADPPQTIRVTAEDVDLVDGVIFMKSDPSKTMTVGDAVSSKAGGNSSVVGVSEYRQPGGVQRVAWAAHAVEVEVDTVTGQVTILRYVAAHDVGRALNPHALEQQIEGGVVMAAGAVLTEELLVDQATGLPLNPNMLDYKPLSIKDAPLAEVILIEKPKSYGTFGAHGIGEPPMAPGAPAIVNAVYNAVGAWVTEMPLTREKLLAALR
ncbi:MAG: xanthine dehydrogenase family protein molybdopterin-binding subunit [Candidatus Limnocylindria bacterium]